jgi:hypothetical protein
MDPRLSQRGETGLGAAGIDPPPSDEASQGTGNLKVEEVGGMDVLTGETSGQRRVPECGIDEA